MDSIPFINKDDPRLPDHYGLTVYYINGKKDVLELAEHALRDKVIFGPNVASTLSAPYLEYWTADDIWGWIPLSAVQRFEFDSRFSKMVALKEQAAQERKKILVTQ